MLRPNLEEIPQFGLPDGFRLRRYKPGDERAWYRIHRLADHHEPVTPDLFARRFGSDSATLQARQLFLLAASGHLIGTATAWQGEDPRNSAAIIGRVHYVAIIPEFQGRGLAKSLMTAVLERLKELGHKTAYLATASGRLPAINLYLRFGFKPVVREPSEAAAWDYIRRQLAS